MRTIESEIENLANALVAQYSLGRTAGSKQPEKHVIIDILDILRHVLFPDYSGRDDILKYCTGSMLYDVYNKLAEQIGSALEYSPEYQDYEQKSLNETAKNITLEFLSKIPKIKEYLDTDVEAAYDGDPAAYDRAEIIISYPGIFASMVNRIAHELYLLSVPLIPRIMTEYAHSITGIDIHPGASIGKYFFIDHGTGVVIGETTVIGNHVKIYQGVTLGALSTRGGQALKGIKRHPTIEDYVTIYSGASILGGNTFIGEGGVIGSNAFITRSIPDQTRVSVKNPELRLKSNPDTQKKELIQDEFWDYII